MSYSIKDKIYTDNPMMDELIHNTKLILQGIILKDQEEADNCETADSIRESDIYVSILSGNKNWNMFHYNEEVLSLIPEFTEEEIEKYSIDNDAIPMEYRDRILDIACELFLANYEELNNYYRKINGQPNYGTLDYYVDPLLIPEEYLANFNLDLPISKFDIYQIGILENLGILDKIKEENPDLKYLNFLGPNKIDVYTARVAPKFDILYIPEAEDIVIYKFKELFDKNRIIYLKRHYSQAYKFNSIYYDKFMMILLLVETASNLFISTPEWYINRDFFDLRTIQYILEANGVKFYPQIPLKYQISLVRFLNKIIKYKSCTKNLYDLADVFYLKNISIYKYYLVKDRLSDEKGHFITEYKDIIEDPLQPDITKTVEDQEKMYDLYFVKTPIEELFDNYSRDTLYRIPYENITTDDKYWDGEDDHNYIKGKILEKDFTIMTTKYMSFDVNYSVSEYQFQLVYFLSLILNNKIDRSSLQLFVPVINSNTTFNLVDLFILLYCLSFNYYSPSTPDIILNTNRSENKPPYVPEESYIGNYPEDTDDTSCDGGEAAMETDWYTMDGGRAKTDRFSVNGNGGRAVNTIVDDDLPETEEDIFDPNTVDIDYNGLSPMDYVPYEDNDGDDENRNHHNTILNNGYAINAYLNLAVDVGDPTNSDQEFGEDWRGIKDKFPYIDMSNRIMGFNMEADLEYLAEVISIRHPRFLFTRGYTLEDLGVEKFKTPENNKINNAEELMDIYNTNKEIYDNFVESMVDCDSYDDYEVYSFVYDYLFTMEMRQDYFIKKNGQMSIRYSEFLQDKDTQLYSFYRKIVDESDIGTRQYNMSNFIDGIIESIESYLNTDLLEYLFYFVPSASWSVILKYVTLLVNFFKSYKVQLFDLSATLILDNKYDNYFIVKESMPYKDIQYEKDDTIDVLEMVEQTDISMEKDDNMNILDHAVIEPYYGVEIFDLDGGPVPDRLFYIDVNGDAFYSIDGNNNNADTEIRMIDAGSATTTADFDENGNTSFISNDYIFIDLDGGSPSLEPEPKDPPEQELEWDGSNANFTIYTYEANGSDSRGKQDAEDYCNNEEYVDPKTLFQYRIDTTWNRVKLNGITFKGKEYIQTHNGKISIPAEITENGITYPVFKFNRIFNSNTDIVDVYVPSSITECGYAAFYNCFNLRKIVFDNEKYLDARTFVNCTSLEDVTLPKATLLADSVFSGCTNLKNLVIPQAYYHIERMVFSGCNNLSTIKIPKSLVYIKDGNFQDIDLHVPLTVNYEGNEAEWKKININATNTLLLEDERTVINYNVPY